MERFSSRSGFTLVETMTAIVLLSLVALMVFAGVQGSLSLSRKGKLKAEGVAILKSVTEDLSTTPATLKDVADKGEKSYPLEAFDFDPSYEARYSVHGTAHGVYRLEVRVIRDGNCIASNEMLIRMPDIGQ
ncbi:MAG TPA: type II secretion system protein [Bacillota bacterium]|nr:type II secretion system protein [Bacillota bacterium]